jgi:hypothetical protein
MDNGIIASGNTLNEILEKLGRKSARYIGNGIYEIKERATERGWSVWIYSNKKVMNLDGFYVDYEDNTWHLDKEIVRE